MLNKVKAYIDKHNLLDNKNLYLIALSGGADSVALLTMLDEMGYFLHAIHCNFHLRGEEADRDERFCEVLCKQKNIPFHRIHFDTAEYASLHQISIEMAARELRYRYFEQLRADIGAAGICVAHHRDDAVETVLLNMARGTGLAGLCGIKPRNHRIIRPFLCLSRSEIEQYLAEKKQPYITDSSNLKDDVLRNKVRLHIVPGLKTLNSAAVENIFQMTEFLTEVQKVMDFQFGKYANRKSLKISEVKNFCSSELLLYYWLEKYGFNAMQIKQIHQQLSDDKLTTGRVFISSQGYELLVDRGELTVAPSVPAFSPVIVPEEGKYILHDEGWLKVETCVVDENFKISKSAETVTVDANKVKFPLTVRRCHEGDKMVPYGMDGHKLLSDLMTDAKMSLFQKRAQLVVVDQQGIIVWVVGMRIDNRVAITAHTKTVLSISVKRA